MKKANIAFEISPLLTASGTFGDKSGVYRYMSGLLLAFAEVAKKNDSQIVLFSFNYTILKEPVNPEIYKLIDNKNVHFISEPIFLEDNKGFSAYLKKLMAVRTNSVLRILNKIFFIKPTLEIIADRIRMQAYVKYLKSQFDKYGVKTIYQSETGFLSVKGLKNIITVYDLTPVNMPEFHRKENRDLQRRKLKFIDDSVAGVVCISKSTQNDLLSYSKRMQAKKLLIGYPGLDKVFLDENAKKTQISFSDLNEIVSTYKNKISKNYYLLYYGTFEPRKNIAYLVKAFADLQREGRIPKNYKLVLSGGEGWGKVKKMISNYVRESYPIPRKNNIIIMDYLNDEYLISLIKNAYAVVYPSLYEGFGLPVLESLALGTPVITSNSSSLPEVGEGAVLYFNPKNFFELKEQIEILIKKPRLAKQLSSDGLKQSRKFNWEKTAQGLYDFLMEL